MSQLDLFRPQRPEPERRPPDLNYVRKSLNRTLRTVRDADILPWSEHETAYMERFFPELAGLLPADEAAAMVAEFREGLLRLRAIG